MNKTNIQKLININVSELTYPSGESLRSFHAEALRAIQLSMKDGNKEFLIDMAVGSGKTLLSTVIAKLFIEIGKAHRVLFLSSMKVMEAQIYHVLKTNFPDIDSSILDSKDSKSKILISTQQKFYYNKNNFNKSEFDLIICDEMNPNSDKLNEVLTYFNAYKLFFLKKVIDFNYRPDYPFNDVIYSYSLRNALLDNTLSVVKPESNISFNLFDEIKQKIQGISETLAFDSMEVSNIYELSHSLGVINDALKEHQELLQESIKKKINKADIITLINRKEQIKIFERLLKDKDYFEEMKKENGGSSERVWQNYFEMNKWIFGYGLNYIFNSPLEEKSLEQVISGFNFFESGKRVDALLKSRGIINSICFVEMKTHLTRLLDSQYRSECWSVSKEVSGAISQIQKYKFKSIKAISGRTDIKNNNGDPTGETIYNYSPKSIVVIGNLSEFVASNGVNADKLSSFELYRKSIEGIEIITFDELYERARFIIEQ